MTDERYVFTQDVKERSRIKASAKYKKNGSKSKKCTTPSDFLSLSEKRKLNGEVMSMIMSKPFHDWKTFRKYPETLQTEYIHGLINNYGARGCDIAEMFGIGLATFYKVCSRYGSPISFGGRGGVKCRTMDERWLDFITTPDISEPVEGKKEVEKPTKTVETNEVHDEAPQVTAVEEDKKTTFSSLSYISFKSTSTKAELIEMLNSLMENDGVYEVFVRLDKREKET